MHFLAGNRLTMSLNALSTTMSSEIPEGVKYHTVRVHAETPGPVWERADENNNTRGISLEVYPTYSVTAESSQKSPRDDFNLLQISCLPSGT